MDEANKEPENQPITPAEPGSAVTPTLAAEPAEPVTTPEVTPETPSAAEPPEKPVEDAPSPEAIVSPTKRSPLKMFLVLLLIIVLAAGAYYALKQTVLKSKATTNSSVSVVKEVPLLRVGTIQGPISADTIYPNPASAAQSVAINYQIFEGLVGYKGDKVAPLLATSWTTPDKNTWVFQLAKNVKFQNGKTMTAADVKASFDDVAANDYWSQFTPTIKSVAVTGANEVTITTAQPDALLLNRLVSVFIHQTNADKTVSGTGAYQIDPAKTPTDSSMSLIAFNDYHQGRPKAQAISFTVYPDDASLIAAAKAKKIDTFEDNLDAKTAAPLVASGYTSTTYELPGSFGLHLNMLKPGGALANPKIREAVNYAINRAAIVSQIPGNTTATQQIVPKSVIGYDATAKVPDYDLAKAKSLQTEAGYPKGAPLTVLYIKGLQLEPPIIIDQLKAAGFQVTALPQDDPNTTLTIAQSGKYDILGQSDYSTLNDATDVFAELLDSQSSDLPVYNNPQFDAMITAAQQEFNTADHIQKVQAINKFITDNVLWIPIHGSSSTVYAAPGYDTAISNFHVINDTTSYWQVGQTVVTPAKQ